jgi:hypothetical protein
VGGFTTTAAWRRKDLTMKATIVDAFTTRLKANDTVTLPETNLRGHWTVVAIHDFGTIDVTRDDQKFYRVTGLNPAINH